jgi:hypothetical protein
VRSPGATAAGARGWAGRVLLGSALAAVAVAATLPASLLAALGDTDRGLARRAALATQQAPSGTEATVSVSVRHAGTPVATNFLGLSFEAEAVPTLARYSRGGTLQALMRSLGAGVLRVGGVSADKSVAFDPPGSARPSWASTAVSREQLAGIAGLLQHTGWSALWTVNLGHYDPAAAAAEAAAAQASFGPRLMGVEIGNEPNAYVNEGLREPGWDLALWRAQFGAYRHAIAHLARGAPIAAPDVSTGLAPLRWVRAAARLRSHLLTDHFYPLTSCNYMQPTIDELLSVALRNRESSLLARLDAIARARGAPLRIDETNDVSCHGEAGVSNSFASALWAVDWTVRAMRAHVAGLNFHDLLDEPTAYSPLVLGRRGRLHANPEWYALLLAARLAGARPLQTAVAHGSTLTAGAFLAAGRLPSTLQVALVNFGGEGSRPIPVHLRVPTRFAAGTVLRLLARSLSTLSGVTLGGSEVPADGAWRPKLPLPQARARRGWLLVQMPPSSAALVTLTARG